MTNAFVLDENTHELTQVETKTAMRSLHDLVGGYVELVTCANGIEAYCDEDGNQKQRPWTCCVHRRAGDAVFLRGSVVFVVRRSTSPEDSEARVRQTVLPLRSFQSTAIAPQPPRLQ